MDAASLYHLAGPIERVDSHIRLAFDEEEILGDVDFAFNGALIILVDGAILEDFLSI